MNVNKIVGLRVVDYVSKKDNQPRHGYEIHYEYSDERVQGVGCGNFYLPARNAVPEYLKPGFEFYILYNQYGWVDGMLPVNVK